MFRYARTRRLHTWVVYSQPGKGRQIQTFRREKGGQNNPGISNRCIFSWADPWNSVFKLCLQSKERERIEPSAPSVFASLRVACLKCLSLCQFVILSWMCSLEKYIREKILWHHFSKSLRSSPMQMQINFHLNSISFDHLDLT